MVIAVCRLEYLDLEVYFYKYWCIFHIILKVEIIYLKFWYRFTDNTGTNMELHSFDCAWLFRRYKFNDIKGLKDTAKELPVNYIQRNKLILDLSTRAGGLQPSHSLIPSFWTTGELLPSFSASTSICHQYDCWWQMRFFNLSWRCCFCRYLWPHPLLGH